MKDRLQLIGALILSAFLLTCQKEFSYSDSLNKSPYEADTQKFIDSSGIHGNIQKQCPKLQDIKSSKN